MIFIIYIIDIIDTTNTTDTIQLPHTICIKLKLQK